VPNKGTQGIPNVKGVLPGNFFDYAEEDEDEAPAPAPKEPSRTPGNIANPNRMQVKGVPDGFFDSSNTHPTEASASSQAGNNVETDQVKKTLPEGFFDNKDADLRARGIEPPKVDIK
jgi:zinc finger protein 830